MSGTLVPENLGVVGLRQKWKNIFFRFGMARSPFSVKMTPTPMPIRQFDATDADVASKMTQFFDRFDVDANVAVELNWHFELRASKF